MRNAIKIITVVLIDAAIFAGMIFSFAWFHHARPKSYEAHAIPTPVPIDTPEPTPTPAPTPAPTELPPEVTPEPTPEQTPEPTPEPNDLLHGKYAEKFTNEIHLTRDGYSSPNVCIELSRHEMTVYNRWPVVYYVADIYIKDLSSLRCFVSDDEDGVEPVVSLSQKAGAIVAISGDYYYVHASGFVIRNGLLYREKLHRDEDVCVLYKDGTVETYLYGHVDVNYIYSKDPWQAWSFGPRLITDGQPMTEFNTPLTVSDRNPRSAFGYYEPGHYVFVLVDGRSEGYSYGVTLAELSNIMYELGCVEAYNMDGGATAVMTYCGAKYSQPVYLRDSSDIIYVVEPTEDGLTFYGGN